MRAYTIALALFAFGFVTGGLNGLGIFDATLPTSGATLTEAQAGDARVELVGADGAVTVLKQKYPLKAGTVVDATFMSARALDDFLRSLRRHLEGQRDDHLGLVQIGDIVHKRALVLDVDKS